MCFETTIIQENGNGCLCRHRSYSMQASLRRPYDFNVPGPGHNGRVHKKAVEWCEGLPSQHATYAKKMELSETIGVTLKDGVWCWTSDMMLVAEVTVRVDNSCVFIRTLYPC